VGEREVPEGRLPIIFEDKYYPRRTLEQSEIQVLTENGAEASESPELGPPPVAHFEVTDPIKFEPRDEKKFEAGETEARETGASTTSTILENRRKRRTSSLIENMTVLHSTHDEPTSEMNQVEPSLKSGAKRKLSARDDEDPATEAVRTGQEFSFQRKSAIASTPLPRTKGTRFVRPVAKPPEASARLESRLSPKKDLPNRKALAPKSANSPYKVKKLLVNDKVATVNDGVVSQPMANAARQERRQSITPLTCEMETSNDIYDREKNEQLQHPPKTPADFDPFSPTSSEPSVKSSIHPTEIAITASVEEVLGHTERGSRRTRTTVSYAEPNLRDKMRRPGKELVAAVEGIDRYKGRESSGRPESVDHQGSERTIKKEKPENNVWNSLPQAKEEAPSPLGSRGGRLSDNSKEKTGGGKEIDTAQAEIEKAVEKLSIFDGPESSPRESPEGRENGENHTAGSKKTTLRSRRHSSNPSALNRLGQEAPQKPGSIEHHHSARPSSAESNRSDGTKPGAATAPRSDHYHRPNSAAELKRSSSAAAGEDPKQGGAAAVAGQLKRSASVMGLAGGGGETRSAATRRRSMMV